MDSLPLDAWGQGWYAVESIGGRCEALTLKAIHGGTGFGSETGSGASFAAGGNHGPEQGIDRLQGISGGFPDCVPVIIQMEAGCWRGCCMIGRAMRDESRSWPANSKSPPNVISLVLRGKWSSVITADDKELICRDLGRLICGCGG